MNNLQIRIPKGVGQRLFKEVIRHGPREPVVFGLVTHASTATKEIVLVRDIRIPPEDAYLPSLGHGARWSGRYMIDLLNEATATRCGLLIFHFHGGSAVRMSSDDSESARQLLPKFQVIVPNRPHGSVVLGTHSVAGAILLPRTDRLETAFSMRQFDKRILDWPMPIASKKERQLFERQPLVRGRLTAAAISASRVAVVGQSGGGTHVSLQLAQHGFGEIWGVDDDYVDQGNRFSGIGFGEKDAAAGKRKVTVLRRAISRIAPRVRYVGLKARVPEQVAIDALKQADVIVGCVNNLHARADLQEIASRYCIPYVDIGLILPTDQASPEEFPPVRAISGNIFTYVPGDVCMWCTGFLSEEKLAGETLGRGRPYLQTKHGADAHVLSFNGVLASQAVNDVVNLVVGYVGETGPIAYRKYDGFKGSLIPCDVKRSEKCMMCSRNSAAGDAIWGTRIISQLSTVA